MASSQKKYGLLIPKKKSLLQSLHTRSAAVSSVFEDNSDDDDEAKARASVNESVRREAVKKQQLKQTQLDMQKALSEDPSVYDYDAVYDEMQEKRKAAQDAKQDKSRKPKYIKNLLKTSEQRKRDFERMLERKAQKEREQEGGMYDDKEAFVTESFKRKMQQLAEDEEKERKQAELDAANDVMKQKDLSGFYRNLLAQNMSKASYNMVAISSTSEESKETSNSNQVENTKDDEEDEKKEEGSSDVAQQIGSATNNQESGGSDVDNLDEEDREEIEQPTESQTVDADQVETVQDLEENRQTVAQEEINPSKVVRRNTDMSVAAARERYLARKLAAARQSQSH